MLTKVEVDSALLSPPTLVLDIGGMNTNPIQILDIKGLEPVKADISTTKLAELPYELFGSSTIGKRNIVFTLGFNPTWVDDSIESLRNMLYTYFMPQNAIILKFFRDTLADVYIEGYVESFEINQFSKKPEAQVSVICPSSDFLSLTPITINGVVLDPTITINYAGSVPTGIWLKIESSVANVAYTGDVVIRNEFGASISQFIYLTDITVDDTQYLRVVTGPGPKSVKYHPDGDPPVSILEKVNFDLLTWIELYPGDNEFRVYGAGEAGQTWELIYQERFGGL